MNNKVYLKGRLGQDPDIRYLPSGDPVANFSLATNKNFKKDGEWKSITTWHKVVAFKFAAQAAMNLSKGDMVIINGEIKVEKWEDKEGNKRESVKINAFSIDKLAFIPKEADSGSGNSTEEDPF